MKETINPTIDTCDLWLPVAQVQFPRESKLAAFFRGDELQAFTLNKSTGEVYGAFDDSDDTRAQRRKENVSHKLSIPFGVAVEMWVNPAQRLQGKGQSILCIRLELSAKQLGFRYLEGITANNLRLIYDVIQDSQYLAFSYEAFLGGWVTDCDFKQDFFFQDKGKAGHPQYKEGCKVIEEQLNNIEARTRPEIKAAGPSRFDRYKLGSGSQSITFNNRNKRIEQRRGLGGKLKAASVARDRQHLMLYNKTLDLLSPKSFLFNQEYNILDQIKGGHLLRLETNISHTAYLRALGYEGGVTLREFLSFTPELKAGFFQRLGAGLFIDSQLVVKVKENEGNLNWYSVNLLMSLMRFFKEYKGDIDAAVSAELELHKMHLAELGQEKPRQYFHQYQSRCKELLTKYAVKANDAPFQTSLDARFDLVGLA